MQPLVDRLLGKMVEVGLKEERYLSQDRLDPAWHSPIRKMLDSPEAEGKGLAASDPLWPEVMDEAAEYAKDIGVEMVPWKQDNIAMTIRIAITMITNRRDRGEVAEEPDVEDEPAGGVHRTAFQKKADEYQPRGKELLTARMSSRGVDATQAKQKVSA